MIDPHKPNFGGTPVDSWRPRLGYAPEDPQAPPAVSIVTPFFRPGAVFRETVECVMEQSLQQWEWIIVDDASDDVGSRRMLEGLRSADPRIRVIGHDANRGRCAARNTGSAAAVTDFVYQLDQDDLLEPTALEKTFWYLVSHPELGFANGWSVAFGAHRYLWSRGFDLGEEFLTENFATGRAMLRRQAFLAVGGYDEALIDGFEDWDLWLRFADRGIWGGTIPEYLDWFRRHDPPAAWEAPGRQQAFRDALRSRHPKLFAGAFPRISRGESWGTAAVSEELPCTNRLAGRPRRLLMVFPWLSWDAGGSFYLQASELLARQGWQVTVAAVVEGDEPWAPAFARCTPDVHVLSRFLRAEDHPRFLRYLIESRRPEVVLVDQAEFASALVPYLRARSPEPAYVGFWHADPNEQSQRASARDAARALEVLDRIVVPGKHLEQSLAALGASPERVEVVPPGVDATVWKPRSVPRGWLRKQWGAVDEPVILFAGRLSERTQPSVLARTLLELANRQLAFRSVIGSDGEERAWLQAFVRRHGLEDRVRLLERQPPDLVLKTMASCDVFFMPCQEGFAFRLLEAMAVGLVVVSADVGGQAELVTPDCGVLIPPGDADTEVLRYADALEPLLTDEARRRQLGRRARERVLAKFGPDRLTERLLQVLEHAKASPRLAAPELPLAFERAIEAARLVHVVESLRRERATLAQAVREKDETIRELRAFTGDQAKAKAWQEQQTQSWKETAEQRAKRIAELEQWARQLEDAKTWHDGQRSHWITIAEERMQLVQDREGMLRDLEAARAGLERERAILSTRIETLLRAWWNPLALRRALADVVRELRSRAPESGRRD